MEIANLGVKQIPAIEAINGGDQPLATANPVLNYPRNEELIVQCVINSEAEGMALLRAVQLLVNTFGASTIIGVITKLEKNPNLVDKAKSNLPWLMAM